MKLDLEKIEATTLPNIRLILGSALDNLKNIPSSSIDLILTDPPYGTTDNEWDSVIPMHEMWSELNRIIKDDGVIALFGCEPFSSKLRLTNLKYFRYDWTWLKNTKTGHLNAKRMPMRSKELVSVFYKKSSKYFPQFTTSNKPIRMKYKARTGTTYEGGIKPSERAISSHSRYPSEIINFKAPHGNKRHHPSEKPVDLLEYFIKTYTLEGEMVLDFTMGSGSTGVAAKNLRRNFIGIEIDDKYFKIAKKRIFGLTENS